MIMKLLIIIISNKVKMIIIIVIKIIITIKQWNDQKCLHCEWINQTNKP